MMHELVESPFAGPQLPSGWTEQLNQYTFEEHALRGNSGAVLQYILPTTGYQKLRFETVITGIAGSHITCSDGTIAIVVDLGRGTCRISCSGITQLASSRFQPRMGETRVAFNFNAGRISTSVNGEEIVSAQDPSNSPVGGFFEFGLWDDCLLHSIRILGEESPHQQPLSPPVSGDFHLEATVDFYDDLLLAPWTLKMFDQLFAELKSWGVTRCHWIYYGKEREGWYQDSRAIGDHFERTIENVGEIFPAAVRAAHAHGLKIYGLIKPFDMGLAFSYGESTARAKTHGKLPRIGGPVGWVANFVAEHRELVMARKPDAYGPAENEFFTRIDLVKQDSEKAAFSVQDIRLYVSEDNATYSLYEGPLTCEEVIEDYPVWEHTSSGGRPGEQKNKSRVMRLKDLEIRSRYFVLSVPGRAESFSNSLLNLIHVFGPGGEERRLTYGLSARLVVFEMGENVAFVSKEKNFREDGIDFDAWPGTPTAIFPGYNAIEAEFVLDANDSLLAIARDKDNSPLAALSPSFPETRAWWLSWVRDCLEEGADGIELRIENHHSPLTWREYGFEKPVRDEFLRRHGVDLWTTDDFDKTAWRRLRGEAFTEFCREAKELASRAGKPLGLNLSNAYNMEPEHGAAMDIHWDWRAWIEKGLIDSITLKDSWPGMRLTEQILSLTRPRGIPVIFAPYANNLWGVPGGEKTCATWIDLARSLGCAGYQFYEAAAVLHGRKDGTLIMRQPALKEVFRQNFGKTAP